MSMFLKNIQASIDEGCTEPPTAECNPSAAKQEDDKDKLDETKFVREESEIPDKDKEKQLTPSDMKPFNLAEIQGPNLSEDESDTDDMSSSSYGSTSKTPKVLSPTTTAAGTTPDSKTPVADDSETKEASKNPDSDIEMLNDLNAEASTSERNGKVNLNIPIAGKYKEFKI